MKLSAPTLWLLITALAISTSRLFAADAPIVYPPPIGAIFKEKCGSCHSDKKQKSGLNLSSVVMLMVGGESGETLITPGEATKSLLWKVIEQGEMPPEDEPRLSIEDKAAINKWIKNGHFPSPAAIEQARSELLNSAAQKHWAFRPVINPATPVVKNKSWPLSGIDSFVLSRLESKKLKPAGDADAYTLLRRIHYDLTGLPPSPAEVKKFVGEAASDFDAAIAAKVDHLLASYEFGERWGRHWLDVARYSDTLGGGANFTLLDAWRYRDYVINSFNKDTPYDRFITEQIAGDLLPYDSPQQRQDLLIATGFLSIGPKDFTDQDKVKLMADAIDEQMDTMGKAFMGLAIGCARCHSHKFDPLPVEDYYAMAGIFHSTQTLEKSDDTKSFQNMPTWNRFPLPTLGEHKVAAKKKAAEAKLNALREQKRQLDRKIKQLGPNAKTEKGSSGAEDSQLAALEKKRDEVDKVIRLRQSLNNYFGNLDTGILGVSEGKSPAHTRINISGNARELGREIPRGVIRALGSPCAEIPAGQSGRLQLSHWLTDGQHPLTARVMANRIWGHLLGKGIVTSTNNFGTTGSQPSHPELLDYLASQLVSDQWSVKKLIRHIMLSRVYRMASEPNDQALAIDPDNTLLWKRSTRRLDIESLHDSLLRFGGRLSGERGGPTLVHAGVLSLGTLQKVERPGLWNRRAVYLPVYRGAIVEGTAAFRTFDFADPNLVVGHRTESLVPTQALFLMNNDLTLDCAENFARRLLAEENTEDARIQRAYLTVLGRPAEQADLQRAKAFLHSSAKQAEDSLLTWSGFCQVLFSSSEFLFIN